MGSLTFKSPPSDLFTLCKNILFEHMPTLTLKTYYFTYFTLLIPRDLSQLTSPVLPFRPSLVYRSSHHLSWYTYHFPLWPAVSFVCYSSVLLCFFLNNSGSFSSDDLYCQNLKDSLVKQFTTELHSQPLGKLRLILKTTIFTKNKSTLTDIGENFNLLIWNRTSVFQTQDHYFKIGSENSKNYFYILLRVRAEFFRKEWQSLQHWLQFHSFKIINKTALPREQVFLKKKTKLMIHELLNISEIH